MVGVNSETYRHREWVDPLEEAKNLTWVRAFYRELFSESGGVPVPGEAYDGTFINHPDCAVKLGTQKLTCANVDLSSGETIHVGRPVIDS